MVCVREAPCRRPPKGGKGSGGWVGVDTAWEQVKLEASVSTPSVDNQKMLARSVRQNPCPATEGSVEGSTAPMKMGEPSFYVSRRERFVRCGFVKRRLFLMLMYQPKLRDDFLSTGKQRG